MPRQRDDIESALIRKNFRREDKHHRYYYYYDGDKFTGAYTFLSMGKKYKTYSDQLISKMKNTLKLDTNKQVKDLIDCPLDEEGFRDILRQKGFL